MLELTADKRDALEAHIVRAEMKDWQNRSFLSAVVSIPVVGAVQTVVDRLRADPGVHWQVGAFALLLLLLFAGLTFYCGFAVEKGKSYLTHYHENFLVSQKKTDPSASDAINSLGYFHFALASYVVFLLWHPSKLVVITVLVVGIVLWHLALLWPKRSFRWPDGKPEPPSERHIYVEAEIKTLRDDIRDWQTRRFTLISLAVATVGLAATTSAKGTLSAGLSFGLALSALTVFLRLTDIGSQANAEAGEILRTVHKASFPFETRVHLLNKTVLGLNYILAPLYILLACASCVAGFLGTTDRSHLDFLLGLPAIVFGFVLVLMLGRGGTKAQGASTSTSASR